MKTRYGAVALLIVGVLVLSLVLTAVLGVHRDADDEGLTLVAAFYPMYTATLRVVGETEGVSVRCLTPPTGGCVHDHQLSPAERALLGEADVLILNGAGAEPFLDPLLSQVTAQIVTTTEEREQHHEHDHEGHDHEGHDHGNDHCWLDPVVYARQVAVICEALCKADPANETAYRANAAAYTAEIEALGNELKSVAADLPMDKAVLFHGSMAFLAEAMGLEVIGTLPLGEDSGIRPDEAAAVADAVRGQNVLFLYDAQYPIQMRELANGAKHSAVLVLGSAVSAVEGVPDADVWVYTMKETIEKLKEVAA